MRQSGLDVWMVEIVSRKVMLKDTGGTSRAGACERRRAWTFGEFKAQRARTK
jgi:hypothetical protein